MDELTTAASAEANAPSTMAPRPLGQDSQQDSGVDIEILHEIRTDDTLPTPRQLFILENLPTIMLKNKEHFQLLVRLGEQPKEGVMYLKNMCKEYGLRHSAGKDILLGRLTSYFFYNTHLFEEKFRPFIDMVEWNKAKSLTTNEMDIAKTLKRQHEESSKDDDASEQDETPLTKDFRPEFLSIVWQAKTLGVLPRVGNFYFCGILYSRKHVLKELDEIDASAIGKEADSVRRRTPACVLRLIQILFFREDFYDRLVSGENGEDFWKNVHEAYTNRYLLVGPLLVDHPLFVENGEPCYDLQQINSPWVTPDKLKDWFTSARRAFQQQNYDGNLETGFAEFADSCDGALDVIYLAGAAQKKGGALALDFLKAPIPNNDWGNNGDGPVILHPSLSPAVSASAKKQTKADTCASANVAATPAEVDDGTTKHQHESRLGKIRISDTLPTPRQLFILENLPTIMSKNRERFQLLVRLGEQPKEGVMYLKNMCKEYGLRHAAGKEILLGRLTSYFFYKTHLFEEKFRPFIDMVAWNKAMSLTTNEMDIAKTLKRQHEESSKDDDASEQDETPLTQDFRPEFLSIVWQAKTLGVLPRVGNFYFCGILYSREHVLKELDELDTSAIEREVASVRRRTPACVLRLIQILFFREDFYDRLVSGENGADFWKNVHEAYTNRYLYVGSMLVDHPLFVENGEPCYDLQQLNSPWVTPDKLKDWFTSARRAFQQQNYDGNLETGFAEFADSCNGALDVIYLAGAAQKKGGALALDFLKAPIPNDDWGNNGDGPIIIHQSLSPRAFDIGKKRTKADTSASANAAAAPTEVDDGTTKHQLESLLEELDVPVSNERENYYREQTKKLKIENMFATKREEIRLLGQKAEMQAKVSEAVLKCYESAKLMEQAGARESAEKLRESAEKLLSDKIFS